MGSVIKGIVCIAILAGVGWFWMRYFRLSEARDTYNKAVANITANKPAEAIPDLDKAAEKSEGDIELQIKIREHYAKAYAAEGERLVSDKQYDTAYTFMKAILTKCPDEAKRTTAYTSLTRAAYETAHFDEAITYGTVAVQTGQGMEAKLFLSRAEKAKKAFDLAAKAREYRKSNPRQAIAAYEAIVADPGIASHVIETAHPYYFLADLYLKNREPQKAAEMLKMSREMDKSPSITKFYPTLERSIQKALGG